MGRPREFDIDDATDRALRAFWRCGYGGTSVADLTAAMGIEKGSLYKAFGDKRAVFLAALDKYLAAGQQAYRDALAAHPADALAAVRHMARVTARGCSGADGPAGCLVVNTMAELGPHDPDVRDRLRDHWDRIGRAVAAALEAGQRAGQVRTDRPAADLARVLLRVTAGTAVFARQGSPDGDDLADTLAALVGR